MEKILAFLIILTMMSLTVNATSVGGAVESWFNDNFNPDELSGDLLDRLFGAVSGDVEGLENLQLLDNGISYDFGIGGISWSNEGINFNMGLGDMQVSMGTQGWSLGYWDGNYGAGFVNGNFNSYINGESFHAGYNGNNIEFMANPNIGSDIGFGIDENGIRTGFRTTGIDWLDANMQFQNGAWSTDLNRIGTNIGNYNFGYTPYGGWNIGEESSHRALKTGAVVQGTYYNCMMNLKYLQNAKNRLPQDATEAQTRYTQKINTQQQKCNRIRQTRDQLEQRAGQTNGNLNIGFVENQVRSMLDDLSIIESGDGNV